MKIDHILNYSYQKLQTTYRRGKPAFHARPNNKPAFRARPNSNPILK